MPQSTTFTSVRGALETTRGTALNPTRILELTEFSHEPSVALIRPPEIRGSYFGRYRAAAGREMHNVSIGGPSLSYNQLVLLANVFFKTNLTGTGVGADKTYPFVPSSAVDDLKSMTLEWGYDTSLSGTQPGFRLPYVVGDELSITWAKSDLEGVKWSAKMHSPKAISQITTFGGTPTSIASTALSPTGTQVFIDATTIGTTADNYVTTAEFTLPHTWTDLDTLNLTTAAQDTFRASERVPSLTLTRYFINDNELDRYNDKAVRKIRVRTTGPTLGAGTYLATLDFYGVLDTDGHRWAEVDGLKMETLKYVNIYDATAAADHSLTVTTAESTVS